MQDKKAKPSPSSRATFDSFVYKECENNEIPLDNYFLGANKIIEDDFEYIFDEKKKNSFSKIFNNLEDFNKSDYYDFINKRNDFYNIKDPSIYKYILLEKLESKSMHLSHWEHVIIDEFQDFNKLETKIILKHLINEKNSLIVGDDDQVLFTFKGSYPECIRKLFDSKNSDHKSFELPYCSRCPGSVVNFVNKIMKDVSDSLPSNRCNKDFLPFNQPKNGEVEFVSLDKVNSQHFCVENYIKNINDYQSTILILHSYEAKKIATDLYNYLNIRGFNIYRKMQTKEKQIFQALEELKKDENSEIGLRLILEFFCDKECCKKIIKQTHTKGLKISTLICSEIKVKINLALIAFKSFTKFDSRVNVAQKDSLLNLFEELNLDKTKCRKLMIYNLKRKYLNSKMIQNFNIQLSQIGDSKGLSADYVLIYPTTDTFFDLKKVDKICSTVVAMTRAKKKLVFFTKGDTRLEEIFIIL